MPYFRHKTEKILYSLTDEPNVTSNTHKGRHSGWTISASIEITYAENAIDSKTGRLTRATNKAAVSKFEAKDSRDQALRDYFSRWTPEDSIEITKDEHDQLKEDYSHPN